MYVVSGGDGFEDYQDMTVDEEDSAGADDSCNHLLFWQVWRAYTIGIQGVPIDIDGALLIFEIRCTMSLMDLFMIFCYQMWVIK